MLNHSLACFCVIKDTWQDKKRTRPQDKTYIEKKSGCGVRLVKASQNKRNVHPHYYNQISPKSLSTVKDTGSSGSSGSGGAGSPGNVEGCWAWSRAGGPAVLSAGHQSHSPRNSSGHRAPDSRALMTHHLQQSVHWCYHGMGHKRFVHYIILKRLISTKEPLL